MQLDHHCVVTGATRTGKTTTSIRLLSSQKKTLKVFVNTKAEVEWTKYCKYQRITIKQFKFIYNNPSKFCDGIIEIFPDIFDEKKDGTEQIKEYFRIVLVAHRDDFSIKTVLLVDEIHQFQNKWSLDEDIARIWMMGLGMGIKAIAVSQRASGRHGIHEDIMSNSEYFIIHQMKIKDLDYMSDYVSTNEGMDNLKFPVNSGDVVSHTAYIQKSYIIGLRKLRL